MEKDFDIHELLSISKWNQANSEAKSKRSFGKIYLELQFYNRQIAILDYFKTTCFNLPSGMSLLSLINAVRRTPCKIISKYSSHILNRVSDWIFQFITKPELSADCVSVFFSANDSKFSFFYSVTFPSLYHHFVTYELQNAAFKFIMRMVNHHQIFLANGFISAFIASNPHFFKSLWSLYDEKASLTTNNGEIFLYFLKSLDSAAISLSLFQRDALIRLVQKDKVNFGKAIIKTLFVNNYIEKHRDMIPNAESHAIVKILEYAGSEPRSPHFNRIVDAMTKSNLAKWLPRHSQTCLDNQTPIILSPHELLMLQKIVQSSREAFNYPSFESESLQIPSTAKYNFESVYIDINLRPVFGESCSEEKISFMFENLRDSFVSNSQSNRVQFDRLSQVAKCFSSTELDLFLFPQKVPLAQQYIQKIPFKNKEFYDYLVAKFRNSMVEDLKAFDVFMTKKSIWSVFETEVRSRSLDLALSLSGAARKLTSHVSVVNPPISNTGSIQLTELLSGRAPICKALDHHNYAVSSSEGGQAYQNSKIVLFELGDSTFMKMSTSIQSSSSSAVFCDATDLRQSRGSSAGGRKQRRRSVNYDKNQANHDFKDSLFRLIDNCRNNDTKLWIYIRNLDDYGLDDRAVVNLRRKYHELMEGQRAKFYSDKKSQESNGISYLKRCSKKVDELAYYKRGTALICLSEITLEIHQVCQFCFGDASNTKYVTMSMKYLLLCLLMSHNDAVFDSFVWYQKLCFCFPDFKSLIPQSSQLAIAFWEASFWQLLKNLEVSLFEQTKDCCQYLFQ